MVIQLQIGFFCLLPRVISHPVLPTQVHVQHSQALFLASRESRPSERVVGSFGPRDANHILVFVHPLHWKQDFLVQVDDLDVDLFRGVVSLPKGNQKLVDPCLIGVLVDQIEDKLGIVDQAQLVTGLNFLVSPLSLLGDHWLAPGRLINFEFLCLSLLCLRYFLVLFRPSHSQLVDENGLTEWWGHSAVSGFGASLCSSWSRDPCCLGFPWLWGVIAWSRARLCFVRALLPKLLRLVIIPLLLLVQFYDIILYRIQPLES